MKELKYRVELFSSYDHTGIEKHLEKMAEKGWLLEKITPFFRVYRRAEPQKLRYAVTYFPKASEFDPEPQEGQLIYEDYSARIGWTFVCRFAQMQIFRNAEEDPVPMETDPMAAVETVDRAARKGFLPYYIVLLFLSCLSWRSSGIAGILWMLLFLLSVIELCRYYKWRKDARKAAVNGVFLDTPRTGRLQMIFSVLLLAGILIYAGENRMRLIACALLIAGFFLTVTVISAVKLFMKRLKAPRAVNITVTLLVSAILSAALVSGVLWVCWHFFVSRIMPLR